MINPEQAKLTVICGIAALLIFAWLLPVVAYLWGGWENRRRRVRQSLGDGGMKLYLETFQAGFLALKGLIPLEGAKQIKNAFNDYYSQQYGRRDFVLPIALIVVVGGLLIFLSVASLPSLKGSTLQSVGLGFNMVGIMAIAGAYMYCLGDLIERWDSCDISPSSLLWHMFRVVVAVPAALALASVVKVEVAAAAAFLLGAFPTQTFRTMLLRLGVKLLGTEKVPESGESELKQIEGIDVRVAGKLAVEGITTAVQLAYTDPVRLAIRVNESYSVIVDWISQAIWRIYARDEYAGFARHGLRGAFEVRDLYQACLPIGDTDEDRARQEWAEHRLAEICQQVQLRFDAVFMRMTQVAEDPCTIFIYTSWLQAYGKTRGPLASFRAAPERKPLPRRPEPVDADARV